jgi:hypothetical protein
MSWANSSDQYPYCVGERDKFLTEREKALGSRVTVRLHDPEGGFRDVLGVLINPTTVSKKDGSLVAFNPEDIAYFKVIVE